MNNNQISNPELSVSCLNEALSQANIPTLLMVLIQMTGDLKWLAEPYAPQRAPGLDDNDTGGLSEEIQAEIRQAAGNAIRAWKTGTPLAIQEPDPDFLARMLSCAMAEPVPASYGEIISSDMGLSEHRTPQNVHVPEGFRVAIIGGGVSGICAAINLRKAGIQCQIFEKNTEYSGTWWENRYPGAGVDTPSLIYTYSFSRNIWDRYFSLQGELLSYFCRVADEFNLKECTSFGMNVDEARWDEANCEWVLTMTGPSGEVTQQRANVVMSAVGILNTPSVPQIPGIETFPGPVVHTAQWPEGLDVAGRRVALIGNGASGMQVAPAIAGQVEKLTIFARSKQWAAPFPQFGKKIPEAVRWLLAEVPLYYDWYRARLMWTFNDRIHGSLQKDPKWPHPERSLNETNDRHREYFTNYIIRELGDRQDLLDLVLPDFPPYGKRILLDNGWYRTVARDNVTLIPQRLAEVRGDRLIAADGTEVQADILIMATGFKAAEFLSSYDIIGSSGQSLRDFWEVDNARAYIGSTIPGFPNFFTLLGPNVGLGHGGSMIKAIELQTSYITGIMEHMFAVKADTVCVRADVFDDYNRKVDEAHDKMVWTHQGTENWYRNSRGRVTAITPWKNDDFWRMTREVDTSAYTFEPKPV